MGRLPDRCEYRVKRNGHLVPCGEPAQWVRPDGEVVTALIYMSSIGVHVGWCCASKVNKLVGEFAVQWPMVVLGTKPGGLQLGGWTRAPVEAPTREDLDRQRRFRHAIREGQPAKVGGLRRMGAEHEVWRID